MACITWGFNCWRPEFEMQIFFLAQCQAPPQSWFYRMAASPNNLSSGAQAEQRTQGKLLTNSMRNLFFIWGRGDGKTSRAPTAHTFTPTMEKKEKGNTESQLSRCWQACLTFLGQECVSLPLPRSSRRMQSITYNSWIFLLSGWRGSCLIRKGFLVPQVDILEYYFPLTPSSKW